MSRCAQRRQRVCGGLAALAALWGAPPAWAQGEAAAQGEVVVGSGGGEAAAQGEVVVWSGGGERAVEARLGEGEAAVQGEVVVGSGGGERAVAARSGEGEAAVQFESVPLERGLGEEVTRAHAAPMRACVALAQTAQAQLVARSWDPERASALFECAQRAQSAADPAAALRFAQLSLRWDGLQPVRAAWLRSFAPDAWPAPPQLDGLAPPLFFNSAHPVTASWTLWQGLDAQGRWLRWGRVQWRAQRALRGFVLPLTEQAQVLRAQIHSAQGRGLLEALPDAQRVVGPLAQGDVLHVDFVEVRREGSATGWLGAADPHAVAYFESTLCAPPEAISARWTEGAAGEGAAGEGAAGEGAAGEGAAGEGVANGGDAVRSAPSAQVGWSAEWWQCVTVRAKGLPALRPDAAPAEHRAGWRWQRRP